MGSIESAGIVLFEGELYSDYRDVEWKPQVKDSDVIAFRIRHFYVGKPYTDFKALSLLRPSPLLTNFHDYVSNLIKTSFKSASINAF